MIFKLFGTLHIVLAAISFFDGQTEMMIFNVLIVWMLAIYEKVVEIRDKLINLKTNEK